MEEKEEEKKSKKKILIILIIFLFIILALIGIFYKLTDGVDLIVVNGNETIPSSEWKIEINNVNHETTGNATFNNDIVVSKSKLELAYSLLLYGAGDSATITFNVSNKGTVDAKLNSIPEVNILSEEQKKYLNYKVSYMDGTSLQKGDILKSLDKNKIKIVIGVKDDVNSSDLVGENINCNFTLNYVQRY